LPENALASAANPALLCDAAGPSSHLTTSFSRAFSACHHDVATIATPSSSSSGLPLPFTMKASRTPGCALMISALNETTLPPNTGHF